MIFSSNLFKSIVFLKYKINAKSNLVINNFLIEISFIINSNLFGIQYKPKYDSISIRFQFHLFYNSLDSHLFLENGFVLNIKEFI